MLKHSLWVCSQSTVVSPPLASCPLSSQRVSLRRVTYCRKRAGRPRSIPKIRGVPPKRPSLTNRQLEGLESSPSVRGQRRPPLYTPRAPAANPRRPRRANQTYSKPTYETSLHPAHSSVRHFSNTASYRHPYSAHTPSHPHTPPCPALFPCPCFPFFFPGNWT